MPPRRYKVDHRHGGNKHVSSFDEVKARNAGEETAYEKARAARSSKKEEEGSDEEEAAPKQAQGGSKRVGVAGTEVENPNAVKRNEEKEGVELTRRQREEIEKAAARRRYEELHKAGKTDEAKADLARLEEVKKRREEAAKKRLEDEAKAKEKEDGDKGKGKSVLVEELKEVMGTEDARMRGSRSSKKKDEKKEGGKKDEKKDEEPKEEEEKESSKKKGKDKDTSYQEQLSTVVDQEQPKNKPTDGSIEQCRAIEADFM